jgi:hypothetical protein
MRLLVADHSFVDEQTDGAQHDHHVLRDQRPLFRLQRPHEGTSQTVRPRRICSRYRTGGGPFRGDQSADRGSHGRTNPNGSQATAGSHRTGGK